MYVYKCILDKEELKITIFYLPQFHLIFITIEKGKKKKNISINYYVKNKIDNQLMKNEQFCYRVWTNIIMNTSSLLISSILYPFFFFFLSNKNS